MKCYMDRGTCRNEPYLLYIGLYPENGHHMICKYHWDSFDDNTKHCLKSQYIVLKPRRDQL